MFFKTYLVLGGSIGWDCFAFSPSVVTSSSRWMNKRASSKVVTFAVANSICSFDETDFADGVGNWPYTDEEFSRIDKSDDTRFYDSPRFVKHIDDNAIGALTDYYELEMSNKKKGEIDVLDLCSSWVSHLPEQNDSITFGKVVGVGMNEEELAKNKQLTEYYVQDLNKEPTLSRFEDDSFDVVCNVVSVDYLTNPLKVFQEMHRVLRPGGIALMSFSNRCFATKAIAMWLQADDIGRLTIVASYFHYSAKWSSIEAFNLKDAPLKAPPRPSFGEMFSNPAAGFAWASTASAVAKSNQGDPMFVVKGVK